MGIRIFPFERVELETPLTREDVQSVLSENVEPVRYFRLSRHHSPFQGRVSPEGFRISRIIHYGNSFLPQIEGRLWQGASGTRIRVEMQPHVAVLAFLTIWFGSIGLGAVLCLLGWLAGEVPAFVLLAPLGMMAAGWAIVSAGFWPEAKKAKAMLIEMLQAAEVGSSGPASDPAPPLLG